MNKHYDLVVLGSGTADGTIAIECRERLAGVSHWQTHYCLAGPGPCDAETVSANLRNGENRELNYRGVPSVVFTLPPLSGVGLTEEAVREKGLDYECHEGSMALLQTMRRLQEKTTAYRILVERGSVRILGAHLLGPGFEEVINLFALAIRFGWCWHDLGQLVSAYPSFSSNLDTMLK